MQVIERDALDTLFSVLKRQTYELIGPTIRDGAIVYNELTSVDNLPWMDRQTRRRTCSLSTSRQ